MTLRHETYALLKEAGDAGRIHFVGNVEANDAMMGAVDVIVTDGFTGNVMLKTMEGVGKFLLKSLKAMFLSSTKTKLAAGAGERRPGPDEEADGPQRGGRHALPGDLRSR